MHWFIECLIHWCSAFLIHSFIDALIHWCTGSFYLWFIDASLTNSLILWFTGSLIHRLTNSLIHWFTDSINRWFRHSLNHWFFDSLLLHRLTTWLTHSLIHWSGDCLVHSVSCALIISYNFSGISTTFCSFGDASHNFNSSLFPASQKAIFFLLYTFVSKLLPRHGPGTIWCDITSSCLTCQWSILLGRTW